MRQALIDIDAELWFTPRPDSCFRDGLGRIIDAMQVYGLSVVGSVSAPPGFVRLIVQGDALPTECSEGWRIIQPVFTAEASGWQRIVRVSDIRVAGRPSIQTVA
jgi:hypothetical protein